MADFKRPTLPPPSRSRRGGMTESTPKSDDFSTLAKAEARRLSAASGSDGCWICDDKPTQICHVLAKEDELLRDLFHSRGMLNFNCSSIDNAIVLCAQCHTKFDMMQDPGWVFYPADLEYFVTYEKNNYESRVADVSRGIQRNRSCPNATEYAAAQPQSGHISTNTVGGLYRRVFLRPLHPHIPPGALAQEKSWFGAPIAALRRAIHATGSFRITAFPSDDLSRLRTLQDLYARPDPGPSSVISPPIPPVAVPRVDTRDDGPPSKKRCLPSDNLAEDDTSEIRSDQIHESHSKAASYWILGPQMSTEEIVSRYASVF